MEENRDERANGVETHGDDESAMDMDSLGKCLTSYTEEGNTEAHRYYLARRTVLEMLKDRGYSVPVSEIDMSLEEFVAIYGPSPDADRLRLSFCLQLDSSRRILVIFCGPPVIKVSAIRFIAAQIVNKETLSSLILILQKDITSQARKALDLFSFKVEIFQITDLLVNITKHVLKPRHQVLTEPEKKKLLKKYNIEEKQLPRLLKKDAIARYYGLERGQVVKVTYSGEITGSHVTYRCVW
ncbi:hypothetical protein K2173_010962 [Erythroxylum novogranatense]|uniref:Uncharacterized protein n=1 Tax=Erythroxylum novogranatense TaxID=1862640 RepID=A0AAV8T049_9ROSI|nr:hypothetical protein K2173_010962 [Erythroxylum novogranatense]